MLKRWSVSAFGFARGDALIYSIRLGPHDLTRPSGLMAVDISAAELKLRTARDAAREARCFTLGGHRAETARTSGHTWLDNDQC